MIVTPDDYRAETGRQRTADLDSAISEALARLLAGAQIRLPGGAGTPYGFSQVLTEWATFNDRATPPAACVVAEQPIVFGDGMLTPSLLEETWARRGEPGLGLYKEAEGAIDLKVVVRAGTKKERSAVCAAVDDLFTAPADPLRGSRYGVLVPMPEYWGLDVRFSLQSKSRVDTGESAQKNRWEATFTISAQAPKVKLDKVVPFRIRLQELERQADGTLVPLGP